MGWGAIYNRTYLVVVLGRRPAPTEKPNSAENCRLEWIGCCCGSAGAIPVVAIPKKPKIKIQRPGDVGCNLDGWALPFGIVNLDGVPNGFSGPSGMAGCFPKVALYARALRGCCSNPSA
jgi:hypothetical protein